MTAIGVFIGGEGTNELGSAGPAPGEHQPGVVEALLRATRREGWFVNGTRKWCRIVKLRAHGASPGEEQNVLGLALEAQRSGARAVAFLRDADNQQERVRTIENGIARARAMFPQLGVIGGCPFPVLEAWILAVLGQSRTEQLRRASAIQKAVDNGIRRKSTEDMVDAIARMDRAQIPSDAVGLRQWLADAEQVLNRVTE